MFSKSKSKEILKFKYLWLIPVLIGMVIYTSCENIEPDTVLSKVNKKRLTKVEMAGYTTSEGEVVDKKVFQGDKEGYFDFYFDVIPQGKIIQEENLSDDEKIEYQRFKDDFVGTIIYENDNGNRGIYISRASQFKNQKSKDYSNADVVPFARIDQVPVYPGCEDAKDQKGCMVKKITEFVNSNFNTGLSKNLGLEAGKKRVYVQFKVDKTGKIVDVKARGPHETLETEAVRVVNGLPQMKPGEQNGKKVSIKYTLPITLVIE